MKIFKLPEDIFPGKKADGENIIFHHYSAPVGSFHGRSMLNKNAISLVISGEKTMHFAAKKVTVKDDEFHFLSSGNCLVSMELNDKVPFKSILIFFDNTTLSNFYLKYNNQIEKIKAGNKISNEPYLAFKKDGFIINFIESLKLLFQKREKISTEMKLVKFEELMLHLLEIYPEKILAFQPVTGNEMGDFEIRRAVESNITNNISVEELAFLCNVSLSTFKRRFARIYGTSPNKWILKKRMEIAKELLQNNREKPGSIFYKIGYENHSSFTKSFKQTFGLTPQDFQNQH
jgi:AraC family transcriptional regulator, exoenzyme S synthesis regulatory protein ExsA